MIGFAELLINTLNLIHFLPVDTLCTQTVLHYTKYVVDVSKCTVHISRNSVVV